MNNNSQDDGQYMYNLNIRHEVSGKDVALTVEELKKLVDKQVDSLREETDPEYIELILLQEDDITSAMSTELYDEATICEVQYYRGDAVHYLIDEIGR